MCVFACQGSEWGWVDGMISEHGPAEQCDLSYRFFQLQL